MTYRADLTALKIKVMSLGRKCRVASYNVKLRKYKQDILTLIFNQLFIFKTQLVINRAVESVKQAFGLPRLW